MTDKEILDYLEKNSAVLTGRHLVFTNGQHGSAYVNFKAVAYDAHWMQQIGKTMAERLKPLNPDVIVGPETLGRTLAGFIAAELNVPGIWCATTDNNEAEFNAKFAFDRFIPGKKAVVIDDLLRTGSSIVKVVEAVKKLGGEPIAAAVIVRRAPEITAESCHVPELITLAEIDSTEAYTPEDCELCAQKVPMTLRPGHGYKWIKQHPDYPVAE